MSTRLRSTVLAATLAVALGVTLATPASALVRTVRTNNGNCSLYVQKTPAHSSVFPETCTSVQARVTYRTNGGSLSTAYGPKSTWESLVNGGTSMVTSRGARGTYSSPWSPWISF